MRLGFDVDGVLADFSTAFIARYIRVTGKNLFHPDDAEDAPCWNWDIHRGYTDLERSAVWHTIMGDKVGFWRGLHPLPDAKTLWMCVRDLEQRHDIYYVTSRVGEHAKRETEDWLRVHIGAVAPTVLISSAKGVCAKALRLDAYLDDNYDNVLGVADESPTTRTFLLTKRYNTPGVSPELPLETTRPLPESVRRVKTLGQMLDYLVLDL